MIATEWFIVIQTVGQLGEGAVLGAAVMASWQITTSGEQDPKAEIFKGQIIGRIAPFQRRFRPFNCAVSGRNRRKFPGRVNSLIIAECVQLCVAVN